MIVPHSLATLLTRTVELFRKPEAKEDQKAQFRALLALLKSDAVVLHADAKGLSVNGAAVQGAAYQPLLDRLAVHHVEEVTISKDPVASQVFELVKGLADAPSDTGLAARLRVAGADTVTVRTGSVEPQRAGPTLDLGAEGILHGASMSDVAALEMPPEGAEEIAAPPPSGAAAPPPALAEPTADALPEPRTVDEAIAALEKDPRAPRVGDLLAALTRFLEEAMRARRAEQALRVIAAVVRCEELASEAGVRRQYSIALKRMYTKPVLEAMAQLVTVPTRQQDALTALQRAGADGVEVLLDLLVAAPTIPERQAIFAALREMKEGTDQLVHMLAHPQWFVVRNVAELVGELGLEDTVPTLSKLLDHADERVRKAVALALAKIGSRAVAEPLRRALRDKSPGVRIQAALGVGGRKSSALAMPLVVAMEEEEDQEVERELLLALGRIGSADAVQALIKVAQPAGRLFGRKPAALRMAAVEALRIAATPAAIGTLQGLADDGDKEVRLMAQEALKDLKK
jgi:HEAT repeat protein